MQEFIPEKYEIDKEIFTKSLLKNLPFYSLDNELIAQIEQECALTKNYYLLFFPEGLRSAVLYTHQTLDAECATILANYEKPKKIRDQVALFTITRIKLLSKTAHNKFAKYFLQPQNILLGNNISWNSCDAAWRYAGDNSTDFNHYTKRGLLLGVYYSGIAYYLKDESDGAVATEEYVMKSIDTIISIASLKRNIKWPAKEDIPFLRLF